MTQDLIIQIIAWTIVLGVLIGVPVGIGGTVYIMTRPLSQIAGNRSKWIVITLAVPIIGFILFLLYGMNRSRPESIPTLYDGPSQETLNELYRNDVR